MMTTRNLAPLATVTILALSALGCSGGSSPTEPRDMSSSTSASMTRVALATTFGTATVDTQGLDFDAERARASVERAYERAQQQIGSRADSIRIDGLRITVRPGEFNGAVGQYHPGEDVVEMAQHVENVLEHELQHRFCHELGFSGSCCTYQDHSPGYDLTCTPRG